MDRLITLLCALVLAAGGMWAWDHHPPMSIPVLFFHVKLPPSLVEQRDRALADAAAARANVSTLQAALDAQNKSVTALKAESDRRLAQSAKAAQQARSVAESYRQIATQTLAAKPKGADICAEADALILEKAR